ncbi:sulfate adenylyltransferase [Nocardioides zeae]|uniref:Sulfate adenylyltransferase n=1 Tax=Nocardioides zeae TaxID=1457234 RepID=A0ACC6IJR8_9ACTN|nr:adenylyl-sulfate kinase [Nocardioides zeae]MDR6173600.1 sulfate adenylyltransferase [Nocardioides zeae]MDR6211006.1 sulfate adenylyltransferase [Nocardioides zeae]
MAAVPQHSPSPRILDDLELQALGVLPPTSNPDELDLPRDLAGLPAVDLVDPEGLPLARVSLTGPDAGRTEPLSRPSYGPFRRLRLTPDERRDRHPGAVVVPVESPLTAAQLADVRGVGDPVVLLVLAGTDWPVGTSPLALVRSTVAAVRGVPDVHVVVVPLARTGDAERDAERRRRVLAAYGEGAAVVELSQDAAASATQPVERAGGVVVFFTGLSGSGKSTLARALVDEVLETTDRTVTSLDGDVVRRNLSAGLSFSPADRETNIRRIGWVAAEIARHGGVAVCSPIAPYDATRREVRRMVEEAGGRFVLVHVATPVEECERRDRKGLYAKARAGEIADFTGISAPYEVPADADVVVDTTGLTVEAALAPVLAVVGLTGESDLEPEPVADPFRVLVVCTANICRSPYLQLALQAAAGETVEVTSAGTHGFVDKEMDAEMAAQAVARGLDPAAFRSRPLTRELVAEADLVLTAEARHRTFVLEEHPAAFKKVFTVGQFARGVAGLPDGTSPRDAVARLAASRPSADGADIADPYRRGPAAAAACADHIDRLVTEVTPALARR